MNINLLYRNHSCIPPPIAKFNGIWNYFFQKKIVYFLLIAPLIISSCIRDDLQQCPPLEVHLIVKDKNYFNVSGVPLETPKSESLAFNQYIPTLFYALRNAETGEVLEEQGVFNVTGNESAFPITFCDCLPFGKYVVTVWGGLPDNATLVDNSLTNIIHPNSVEGSDVYLAHDTLVYDLQHTSYTMDMERVTGKLIVQVINLPATVNTAKQSSSNLYERVNYKFNYSNPITVNKTSTWAPINEIVLHKMLAPSSGNLQTLEHLDFYEAPAPAAPALTTKDVYITLKRNELTTLKYVYDDEKRDFSIYILQNDSWEIIHDLDIN